MEAGAEEESSRVMPRNLAAESTAMPALSREARAPTETPMRPIISQRSHWRLFFGSIFRVFEFSSFRAKKGFEVKRKKNEKKVKKENKTPHP